MTHRLTSLSAVAAVSLSALSLALSGCRAIDLDQTGEMVAVYRFGEFHMLLNSNAPSAVKAVEQTLPEFDLYQVSAKANSHDALITARNRADQIVRIELTETNAMQTTIKIHWGSGGDRRLSQRFFESVDRKLAR